ncbi:MAG: RusA family crossover junction endodeoxyribonuclease [Pyramidobacter sp.]|nr:RusA family crossover junction endodeoxyribonuclease [Pyramidobacter sp.]
MNHLYRNSRAGIRYKTATGRRWQEDVALMFARMKRNRVPYEGHVALEVVMTSSNRLRWDVDNRVKALQDCLSMSGVVADDKQVIDLHAQRIFGETEKTRVTVTAISPDLAENPCVKMSNTKKTHGNAGAKK